VRQTGRIADLDGRMSAREAGGAQDARHPSSGVGEGRLAVCRDGGALSRATGVRPQRIDFQ